MDATHNITSFNTMFRQSYLKKTGGHLSADVVKLYG